MKTPLRHKTELQHKQEWIAAKIEALREAREGTYKQQSRFYPVGNYIINQAMRG